ncbi:MAG: SUMF1/EgtB/PvdO family nonheme iron enzyme [Hyphomonadaceae bacterium]
MRRLTRPLLWLAGLVGAAALLIYALAQIALLDEARLAETGAPAPHQGAVSSGGLRAIADGNGAVLIYRGEELVGVVGGHTGQIEHLAFIDGGQSLVTADSAGRVRATPVSSAWSGAVMEDRAISQALLNSLWTPYGRPLAQASLLAAAQVLPLHVPEAMRGERGAVLRDCDVCPEIVPLTGGHFFRGAPLLEIGREPSRRTRRLEPVAPFAIGRFEVTVGEWNACVADEACEPLAGATQQSAPISGVRLDNALAYVNWLSRRTGETYRLPTAAEWEYAARAGSTSAFAGTHRITPRDAQYKWDNAYLGASTRPPPQGPAPVGSFPGNAFGLFDMHGNVQEWTCEPGEAGGCQAAGVAGGAWLLDGALLRSASQHDVSTDDTDNTRFFTGLRVVRALREPQENRGAALDGAPSDFQANAYVSNRRARLQTVPFARNETGIELYGNANTWWTQAEGRYERSRAPGVGGVMVLRYADRGHLSVVTQIVSPRIIVVDHANFLNEGEISRNVPVEDVSPNGDWSRVRVWSIPLGTMGARIYEVEGFILNRPSGRAFSAPL